MSESNKKIITQIVVQKKRKDRCSIFLDDEFELGVHQDVILKFGLKKGDALTEKQLNEIILAEEKKKAFDRAIRILAHRDRSEKELRTKLMDAGFEEKIINHTISELKRLGFIDDNNFARLFAKNKMMSKPMGRFLLRRELRQKGIDEQIIDETVEDIFRHKDEYDFALEVAARKKRQLKNYDETKARKKVSDLLARRGFNWDVISYVLEHWNELENEQDER